MLGKVDKESLTYNDYCHKIFVRNKIFFILKIIALFAIWTPLIVYYFLPISKANIVTIDGNALNFNEEYIYNYTELDNNKHIWTVDTENIEKQLYNHPYCTNAKVSLTFSGVKININEIKVVAKSNDIDPVLYLSNGSRKTLSSIKDNIDDPLSLDSKFIKPYIDHIPLIYENEYKRDDLYTVVNNLGKLDQTLVDQIKEVKINKETNEFTLISLIINSEDINTNNDLILNVDYRDIYKLVNEDVINKCIENINNNKTEFYNVLLENDIESKQIKVVPYTI